MKLQATAINASFSVLCYCELIVTYLFCEFSISEIVVVMLFQNEWNSLWWASENCALLFSSGHIKLQRVYEVWLFNVATKGVLAMWTRVPSALTCVKPIIGCNMTCPQEGLARNVFFHVLLSVLMNVSFRTKYVMVLLWHERAVTLLRLFWCTYLC